MKKKTVVERFLSHVTKTDGCWLWNGCRDAAGYGQFGYEGKVRKSHVVSYLLFNGELTKEKPKVLHTCDTPPCVNPAHLEAGTQKKNMKDAAARKRLNIEQSTLNLETAFGWNRKLDDKTVTEIRSSYVAGKKGSGMKSLAKKYNIDYKSMWLILNNRTYKAA